jgi:hypothetical protein
MDLNDFNAQLQNNIRTLLSRNELTQGTPAFGVAMQVMDCGFHSLS